MAFGYCVLSIRKATFQVFPSYISGGNKYLNTHSNKTIGPIIMWIKLFVRFLVLPHRLSCLDPLSLV